MYDPTLCFATLRLEIYLKADEFVWEVIYPTMRANGDKCDIQIEQEDRFYQLKDVVFGDIWVCSGQSNMVRDMGFIINATEEIAASINYTNIRMLQVLEATSADPEDDLINGTWPGWYTTTDSGKLDEGWQLVNIQLFYCTIYLVFNYL